MNNIFIIRSVEFDQQKEDPFGFDNGAGRIADKYLTFSGVIVEGHHIPQVGPKGFPTPKLYLAF